MLYRQQSVSAIACSCALVLCAAALSAQQPAARQPTAPIDNELDAFMAKVLARREVNRKTLEQYILDEVETFEILGPGRMPLHRSKRDFTWYVRDGMHVRSPIKYNGVGIGEEARRRYETNWIRRERARQTERARREKQKAAEQAKRDAAAGQTEAQTEAQAKDQKTEENKDPDQDKEKGGEISIGADGVTIGGAGVPTEPRFVSEAYFMDFKFEAGTYYLAGREQLEGQEVLKIEYYPTKMFGDNDNDRNRSGDKPDSGDRQRREREQRRPAQRRAEEDIERRMNKTALVTLWVDPKEHQIVKYTFDNVWLDFLPAAWLVHVDDIRASMVMGQPFPGVWLPRGLNIHAGVTLANGSFEAGYERTFSDYRLAEVETKMRIPKKSASANPGFAPVQSRPIGFSAPVPLEVEDRPHSGPFVQEPAAQPGEVIGEIRIHGNAFLSDKEVLDIAGVAVGQPLGGDGVEGVSKRLKSSNRFETVDVRKRYRSLTSTTDVALVLVVHEKPGVRSAIGGVNIPGVPDTVARPVGRLRSKLMFLPIVSFADGYGFTYGGRMSTVDLLGIDERLSVPLTWGGTRRAALEFERLFKTGPLTRIDSSVAIWNRENPRFDIRDQRVEVRGRAERVFGDLLRAGVEASRSTISFGELDDRLWTLGSSATLDTRLDPSFPGNAVLLTAGWTGLNFRTIPDRVNRYTADARGYLRVFRQVVVAGRAQYVGADASLPPYERLLLGGSSSLRGFRTGTFDGDRTLAASAELRVPITSVLSGAKLGLTAFMDAGKVWDVGQSADGAPWHRGIGGGVFLIASIVKINLDVARGLKTGDTRVHLSSGFVF